MFKMLNGDKKNKEIYFVKSVDFIPGDKCWLFSQ